MSPWISPPFRRNISATCSSRMPSASPWMKNMGAVVALSLSAPRSCPFVAVARIRLTNFGNSSGVGLSFLYSTSMGEPLKASAVSFGNASSRFLDHAVAAERGRNDDHLPHLVRMADRTLHRHAAAHAVADEVRLGDLEVIEQRRHIVGKVLAADVAFDVRRAAVALHFDGDHFPRFGKLADPPGPVVGDGHERAVEQHHRFAAAVDFVVHFESVDRRVARRWLLLRRYDSRHEHRQEKSCCLHVWCKLPFRRTPPFTGPRRTALNSETARPAAPRATVCYPAFALDEGTSN